MVGNGVIVPVDSISQSCFPFSNNRLRLINIHVSEKMVKNLIFVLRFSIDNFVVVEYIPLVSL